MHDASLWVVRPNITPREFVGTGVRYVVTTDERTLDGHVNTISRTVRAIVGAVVLVSGSIAIGSGSVAHAAGGTISGVVRDAQGDPIPNATVRAMADEIGYKPRITVTADANGAFIISDLVPEVYRIGAVATGFAAGYANAPTFIAATPFAVTSAQTFASDITLYEPTATISGRVLDDHGDPVMGATVNVGTSTWPMGMAPFATYTHFGRAVQTGPDGRYTATGLAPGAFMMNATPSSPTLIGGWYPSLEPPITTFAVTEGATVSGIDLTMVHSGTVTGRITDASGAPVQGANVLTQAWDGPHQTLSAADGTYTITGVEPGLRFLLAQVLQGASMTTYYGGTTFGPEATTLAVPAGGTIAGIDIQLVEGVAVLVHVSDAGGQAPASRNVRGCRAPGTPFLPPNIPSPWLDCSNSRPAGELVSYASNGDVTMKFAPGDYQVAAVLGDYSVTGTGSLRVARGDSPVCTLRVTGPSSCSPTIPLVVTPPVVPPAVITEVSTDLAASSPYARAERVDFNG